MSLAQPTCLFSPETGILCKHLYNGHLVAYHSVNMAASERFDASPLSAAAQNSIEIQTRAQDDIKFCIS